MKIWTGKTCLTKFALTIVVSTLCLSACATSPKGEKYAGSTDDALGEYKSSEDRKALEELRKAIPEETRKANDKLAEYLNRWKVNKTPPETLRSKYNEEISKMRREMDKKWRRMREDFQREMKHKREDFLALQKTEREKFFKSKPSSDRRATYMNRQGIERDRMNADLRDRQSDFDERLKEERKKFEDEIAARRLEFTQEYPEYVRNYNEMKKEAEAKREANKGKSYQGWPYKDESTSAPHGGISTGTTKPAPGDVNKAGNGWPITDPAEFEEMPKKGK